MTVAEAIAVPRATTWAREGIAALGAAAALVAFHALRAGEPLGHEELTWWFELARSWHRNGTFVGANGWVLAEHSPLYAVLIAAVFAVAGEGVGQARALGLVIGLATLGMFWRLARALASAGAFSERWVAVALAVYALHPLTLQSTLALEPDTTLAPLAMLILADVGVRSRLFSTRPAIAAGGIALAAVLAAKVYDAAPAVAALWLTLAIRSTVRAAFGRVAGLLAVATIVAVVLWLPVTASLGLSPARPLVYLADSLFDRLGVGRSDRLVSAARDSAVMAIWLSPALCVGAALTAIASTRRPAMPAGLTFVAVWGVLHTIAFAVAGGVLFGFPKYQAPATPLLVLGAVAGLAALVDRTPLTRAVVVGAVAGAAIAVLGGDPLHVLRIDVKVAALVAPDTVRLILAWLIAIVIAALVVPTVVTLFVTRSAAWPVRAALALVSAHVSCAALLVVSHATADYATRYAYGERGVADVADFLRREARAGTIVAPHAVTFELAAPYWGGGAEFWRGAGGRLVDAAQDPGTAAVVWSLAHHEISQLRYAERDAALGAALADEGYRSARIGTFLVWYRPRVRS